MRALAPISEFVRWFWLASPRLNYATSGAGRGGVGQGGFWVISEPPLEQPFVFPVIFRYRSFVRRRPMQTDTLAVDFGTSNSAVSALDAGAALRIPIEQGAETLPTAVFFPTDKTPMRIGTAAAYALVAGEAGRYMRSLKSVLGLALLHELRPVGGRQRTLVEIITDFLAALRQRAEQASGRRFRLCFVWQAGAFPFR